MGKDTGKTTGQELAAAKNHLPSEIMQGLAMDAGMGAEDVSSEDMQIPFIKIAQSLSPEVDENDAKYIQDIKVGDFFNTATQRLWSKQTGFHYIPVYFVRKYLEWTPRDAGGGFNGEHGPEIMDKTSSDGKGGSFLPNGNEIQITGTWFGFVVDKESGEVVDQAVIALSKTQLKKSRGLMTKLKSVVLKSGDGKPFNPPLFYNVVKVSSVPEQNDQGKWYGWKFELDGNVFEFAEGPDIYDRCKVMLEAVRSGALTTQRPDAPAEEGGDAGGSSGPANRNIDEEIPF